MANKKRILQLQKEAAELQVTIHSMELEEQSFMNVNNQQLRNAEVIDKQKQLKEKYREINRLKRDSGLLAGTLDND